MAAAWRQLTSMRTALLLLFLLAVAAVPGSLLPQRPVNPLRVRQFLAEHRTIGPVLDRLFGFAVFASPWFSAIYVLLMVSLVGCVLPRLRQHARSILRRPPSAPANPSRLPGGAAFNTSASSNEVLEAGERLLRRFRYRLVVARPSAAEGTVAAEKGYLRETGNLLFHASLIVLLVGVALGSLFGYSGSVLVVEGRSFANTRIAYDSFVPGARVDSGRLDRSPSGWRTSPLATGRRACRATSRPGSL